MKFLLLVLLCSSCFREEARAQKGKVMYTHNFPPQMEKEVRGQYIVLFEKGKILYQLNCAKCHNTRVKGVETMPEFTKEHLANYELRLQNMQHETELTESRVNAEELQQIMIFLTYYKRVANSK